MQYSKMIFVGMLIAVSLTACNRPAFLSPDKPKANANAKPDPTPRPSPRTPLEASLNYIANGNFIQIKVFTRLDGGTFTKDDFDYLKANAPEQTNQWLKSDDGRNVVAGTNFPFKPEHLDALAKHFKIDDQSAEYGRKTQ